MRRFSIILAATAIIMGSSAAFAQNIMRDPLSCTSIMVGKKASADGSVITSHTCDSWYRQWVNIVPAKVYANDTITEIYDGRMHTEYPSDRTGMKVKGTIPQAKSTFAFVDTSYPCLNEKQLGIGETTITGRRELKNPNGMFMIEELERIALERCTTAREAIKLMGELIKKYGYGDSGECLTIADPNEVWHFEVFGEGKDKIGGVWAAVRIPDDEVGVSANIPRISEINLKNPDRYMASENVFEVAKRNGWWDGKEPFKFWKAYNGKNYFGEPKAFSVREYYILNKLAPSLNLKFDAEELPLSVKPEKKVDVTDVMALLRETYEGTEWDNTKNLKVAIKNRKTGTVDTIISPKANPWMRSDEQRLLNALNKGIVAGNRNVAVPQCAYSTVIQLRSWLPDDIGGVLWLGLDNPGQSPRVPIFCGTTDLPAAYKVCANHRYRDDSAAWVFRKANKLAALNWGKQRKSLENARNYLEAKGQRELPFVEAQYQEILKNEGLEAARNFLTQYTADFIGASMLRWDELASKYWNDARFGF